MLVGPIWGMISRVHLELLGSGMDGLMAMRTLLKGTAMHIVVGPVLTRKGGYAFDCWTPQEGLSLGYAYGRVEDAHYARNVEIRSRKLNSCSEYA